MVITIIFLTLCRIDNEIIGQVELRAIVKLVAKAKVKWATARGMHAPINTTRGKRQIQIKTQIGQFQYVKSYSNAKL